MTTNNNPLNSTAAVLSYVDIPNYRDIKNESAKVLKHNMTYFNRNDIQLTGDGLRIDQSVGRAQLMKERQAPMTVNDYQNPIIITNIPHRMELKTKLENNLRWTLPETVYSKICTDARTLPKIPNLEKYISPLYSNIILENLMNIYQFAPVYYTQAIMKNDMSFFNYQKFIYLLTLIVIVYTRRDEFNFMNIDDQQMRDVLEWCRTRMTPDINYILMGPNANTMLSLDFVETYNGLISPSNDHQSVTQYLQLTTMQAIHDNLNKFRQEEQDKANVFYKNPNVAGCYTVYVDTTLNAHFKVDTQKNLVVDCSNIDLGSSISESLNLNINKAEINTGELKYDPKTSAQKLTNIMNEFTIFKIINFLVKKTSYKTSLNIFDKLYVVFPQITVDGKFNQIYKTGSLQISGKFITNSNDKYWEFVPDSENGIVYKPTTADVKMFEFYITRQPNATSPLLYNPYKSNAGIDYYYNIPIIVQTGDYVKEILQNEKLSDLIRNSLLYNTPFKHTSKLLPYIHDHILSLISTSDYTYDVFDFDLLPDTYIIRISQLNDSGEPELVDYTFLYNRSLLTLQLLPQNFNINNVPKFNSIKKYTTKKVNRRFLNPIEPAEFTVINDAIKMGQIDDNGNITIKLHRVIMLATEGSIYELIHTARLFGENSIKLLVLTDKDESAVLSDSVVKTVDHKAETITYTFKNSTLSTDIETIINDVKYRNYVIHPADGYVFINPIILSTMAIWNNQTTFIYDDVEYPAYTITGPDGIEYPLNSFDDSQTVEEAVKLLKTEIIIDEITYTINYPNFEVGMLKVMANDDIIKYSEMYQLINSSDTFAGTTFIKFYETSIDQTKKTRILFNEFVTNETILLQVCTWFNQQETQGTYEIQYNHVSAFKIANYENKINELVDQLQLEYELAKKNIQGDNDEIEYDITYPEISPDDTDDEIHEKWSQYYGYYGMFLPDYDYKIDYNTIQVAESEIIAPDIPELPNTLNIILNSDTPKQITTEITAIINNLEYTTTITLIVPLTTETTTTTTTSEGTITITTITITTNTTTITIDDGHNNNTQFTINTFTQNEIATYATTTTNANIALTDWFVNLYEYATTTTEGTEIIQPNIINGIHDVHVITVNTDNCELVDVVAFNSNATSTEITIEDITTTITSLTDFYRKIEFDDYNFHIYTFDYKLFIFKQIKTTNSTSENTTKYYCFDIPDCSISISGENGFVVNYSDIQFVEFKYDSTNTTITTTLSTPTDLVMVCLGTTTSTIPFGISVDLDTIKFINNNRQLSNFNTLFDSDTIGIPDSINRNTITINDLPIYDSGFSLMNELPIKEVVNGQYVDGEFKEYSIQTNNTTPMTIKYQTTYEITDADDNITVKGIDEQTDYDNICQLVDMNNNDNNKFAYRDFDLAKNKYKTYLIDNDLFKFNFSFNDWIYSYTKLNIATSNITTPYNKFTDLKMSTLIDSVAAGKGALYNKPVLIKYFIKWLNKFNFGLLINDKDFGLSGISVYIDQQEYIMNIINNNLFSVNYITPISNVLNVQSANSIFKMTIELK